MKKAIDYLIFANAALTVIMTLVVIYTIWTPYDFGSNYGWKIFTSYLVMIANLAVLFKVRDIYATQELNSAQQKDKDV